MTSGFLVVDKPEGITSHDAVAILRAVLGLKRIGHTGTLDPFATGVLPLALDRATSLIQYLDEDLKVYDATIQLGSSTDTGDLTGTVVREAPVPQVDADGVRAVLETFRGVRMQLPPRYSAVKVAGRRLYAYARAGEEVQAQPRPVRIDAIELVELELPRLRVRITCGRGTYARVLADEIAVALGSAGHLVALRRERSGVFDLEGALSMDELAGIVAGRSDWRPVLRPPRGTERVAWRPRDEVRAALTPRLWSPARALAHLPVLAISPGQRDLMQRAGQTPAPPPGLAEGQHFRAQVDDELIALLRVERGRARMACLVVLG